MSKISELPAVTATATKDDDLAVVNEKNGDSYTTKKTELSRIKTYINTPLTITLTLSDSTYTSDQTYATVLAAITAHERIDVVIGSDGTYFNVDASTETDLVILSGIRVMDAHTIKGVTINITSANAVTVAQSGDANINDIAANKTSIANLNSSLARLYPVGSIYLSTNSTNPATFLGGTWERIKDRFLLAAGDTYAAGDSGGSASHSHTLSANGAACIGNFSNVTAFSSDIRYSWKNYNSGSNMWTWTHSPDAQLTSSIDHYNEGSFVSLTGSTDSDNSMPPYLAVYMWRRVA